MSDAVLANTDRKEALSRAYVAAVAAGAGYTLAYQDFDRDGVDVQVRAGYPMRPVLDIQLKATINLNDGGADKWLFSLPRRNYDLLVEETVAPRILVVLNLPREESEWINVSAKELAIRRCAYWTSLSGSPPTKNETSKTISLDKNKRFDVDALRVLMDLVRTGGIK